MDHHGSPRAGRFETETVSHFLFIAMTFICGWVLVMRCRAFCPNPCWNSPVSLIVIRLSTKIPTPFDAATDSVVEAAQKALLEISVFVEFLDELGVAHSRTSTSSFRLFTMSLLVSSESGEKSAGRFAPQWQVQHIAHLPEGKFNLCTFTGGSFSAPVTTVSSEAELRLDPMSTRSEKLSNERSSCVPSALGSDVTGRTKHHLCHLTMD